ncbi:MAG: hypothetical protein HUU10_11495 [Bacteroidetes bacterium]|nr:hypothetical protein [Bacteroidota bacterium]
MKKRIGFLVWFSVLLTGCLQVYYPFNSYDQTGFGDIRLTESTFRITFKGKVDTPKEVVEELALLRAAEVALEQEGPWFVVLNTEILDEPIYKRNPEKISTEMKRSDSTLTRIQTAEPGYLEIRHQYHAILMISIHKTKPDQAAFVAEYLVDSIRKKYGIKTKSAVD